MATYRAYHVDHSNRIRSAEWLEAPNDEAALEQAEDLCEQGLPTIEVWQAARLVDQIDCEDDD